MVPVRRKSVDLAHAGQPVDMVLHYGITLLGQAVVFWLPGYPRYRRITHTLTRSLHPSAQPHPPPFAAPPPHSWPRAPLPPLDLAYIPIPHDARRTIDHIHRGRQGYPQRCVYSMASRVGEEFDGGELYKSLESKESGTKKGVRGFGRGVDGHDPVSTIPRFPARCETYTGMVGPFLNLGARLRVRRNDIASCHEKAYQALPLAEASRLLFFNNESEAAEFGQQVRYPQPPLNSQTGV